MYQSGADWTLMRRLTRHCSHCRSDHAATHCAVVISGLQRRVTAGVAAVIRPCAVRAGFSFALSLSDRSQETN